MKQRNRVLCQAAAVVLVLLRFETSFAAATVKSITPEQREFFESKIGRFWSNTAMNAIRRRRARTREK